MTATESQPTVPAMPMVPPVAPDFAAAPAYAASPVFAGPSLPAATTLVLPPKSVGVAYLLLFLAGAFGVHHFYLGKPLRGVLYLLTFGFATVGVLIDWFTLASQTRMVNLQRAVGL